MKRNWRTSLGGAIGVFGTVLVGAPVVWMASQSCPKWVAMVAMGGFFMTALGKAATSFFAADAKVVADLKRDFDTDHFSKR
jgi:hypothetical protein